MSIDCSDSAVNPVSLVQQFDQLVGFVKHAVRDGIPLGQAEQNILSHLASLGHAAISIILQSQGDGDLGQTVEVDGKIMTRSEQVRERTVRSLFGEHVFSAYVYGVDIDRKIDFRPIDVRLRLLDSRFTPKLQEIVHRLVAEMAFQPATEFLETIFGQPLSVNSLERLSRNLATEADAFLQQVPIPASTDEGAILVVSADGKGVPMIREKTSTPMAFERREFPGNRQMATLAAVYSVDPFVRTPEQIVDALFRETTADKPPKRPEPVGKVVVGYMTRVDDEGQPLTGTIQALAWADQQVQRRHQADQPLVRLMDGQASLWDAAAICLSGRKCVDILDIIHVSSYIWTAAKVFSSHREHQEHFTHDRLLRILRGDVGGVISGLRQMATKHGLSARDRTAIEQVCTYFDNNRDRMRYHEYLAAGYPIATGVIEGACRHLVMDRMCRTGMRWGSAGSQAMLHVRAVNQADLTTQFHTYRTDQQSKRTSKFHHLLKNYQPLTLCG